MRTNHKIAENGMAAVLFKFFSWCFAESGKLSRCSEYNQHSMRAVLLNRHGDDSVFLSFLLYSLGWTGFHITGPLVLRGFPLRVAVAVLDHRVIVLPLAHHLLFLRACGHRDISHHFHLRRLGGVAWLCGCYEHSPSS